MKCVDCGEILSQDPETEFAPHVVSTWTVTDPATETKEGEKKGKCDVCETEFIVKTDKLTATLKPENVVATEGGKIELGETKLPENTVAAIAPEEEANLDEIATEMKTEFDKIPEAAGKELLAVTGVVILLPDTYQDPATGETVVDDSVTDKLPGKVKVTAPVAADLSNYENVVVLVMDAEGKVTKLNATVENGSVVFETDSAVAGVMVLGSAKQAPAPGNNEAQTGDASQVVLFITLALVSVLSLGGIVVSKKARASK